jgi:hypothetical protein
MTSAFERFVGVFEFSVRVSGHPDYPVPVYSSQFSRIENALLAARANNKLIRKELDEGRLFIILDDISIVGEKIGLLFTVVDADAAEAVYRDLKSDAETIFAKGPDQGGAASAHLVIDLAAKPNVHRYKAGLEDIEGVARSRIIPFLQDLLRTYCGQAKVIIDGVPFTGDAVAELQSLHKDKIGNAAGRPLSVELVHLEPRKRLDAVGAERYRERSRTVEFSIEKKGPIEVALEALRNIRLRQQTELSDYPVMRIRWKRPDGKTQTLSVDNIAEDLMQRAFTRLELVSGFVVGLRAATKKIRTDLTAEMFIAISK